MQELMLKKCLKCNALIKVIQDCECRDCSFICCNEKMIEVKANSVDAAFEKHVPMYEKVGDQLRIYINHVMEEEHYIEWILVKMQRENRELLLKPGENPEIIVPYEKGALLYGYCNKHGLWKSEVK